MFSNERLLGQSPSHNLVELSILAQNATVGNAIIALVSSRLTSFTLFCFRGDFCTICLMCCMEFHFSVMQRVLCLFGEFLQARNLLLESLLESCSLPGTKTVALKHFYSFA